MNSNDDQSSLPATKICTRRRNAKRYTSRGALFTLLVAVAIFLTTPRFAQHGLLEGQPRQRAGG